MSLENQVTRVSQGMKDTLKTLINKLGGNVTDELIDQYQSIASALDDVDPAGSAQQALRDAKSYTDQKISEIPTPPKAEIFSVSLPASRWSNNAQTVSHAMLKAAGYGYIYNPDETSYGAYVSALVRCGDVVTDGQVTFYCDETPTEDITVDFMRSEANENV